MGESRQKLSDASGEAGSQQGCPILFWTGLRAGSHGNLQSPALTTSSAGIVKAGTNQAPWFPDSNRHCGRILPHIFFPALPSEHET